MAKIDRIAQKQFGSIGQTEDFGIFGSLAEGAPATSKDIAAIQSLSAFVEGWRAAIAGANSPALEDMNSLFLIAFYQLAYVLQTGIPEWNAETTYYENSWVSFEDNLYISLVDDNLNEPPTGEESDANWALFQYRYFEGSDRIGLVVDPITKKITFDIINESIDTDQLTDRAVVSEKIGLGEMMPRVTVVENTLVSDTFSYEIQPEDEYLDGTSMETGEAFRLVITREYWESPGPKVVYVRVKPTDITLSPPGIRRMDIVFNLTLNPGAAQAVIYQYNFISATNYVDDLSPPDSTLLFKVVIDGERVTASIQKDRFVFSLLGSGTLNIADMGKDVLVNVSSASGTLIVGPGQILRLWNATAGASTFTVQRKGSFFNTSVTVNGDRIRTVYVNGNTLVLSQELTETTQTMS